MDKNNQYLDAANEHVYAVVGLDYAFFPKYFNKFGVGFQDFCSGELLTQGIFEAVYSFICVRYRIDRHGVYVALLVMSIPFILSLRRVSQSIDVLWQVIAVVVHLTVLLLFIVMNIIRCSKEENNTCKQNPDTSAG